MKPVFFLVLLVALAGPVTAQEQKPAPKPEAAKKEPKKKPTAAASKAKRQQDARHCLQRPTNTEIIKCAEAYL